MEARTKIYFQIQNYNKLIKLYMDEGNYDAAQEMIDKKTHLQEKYEEGEDVSEYVSDFLGYDRKVKYNSMEQYETFLSHAHRDWKAIMEQQESSLSTEVRYQFVLYDTK